MSAALRGGTWPSWLCCVLEPPVLCTSSWLLEVLRIYLARDISLSAGGPRPVAPTKLLDQGYLLTPGSCTALYRAPPPLLPSLTQVYILEVPIIPRERAQVVIAGI